MERVLLFLFWLHLSFHSLSGHREHKVHNIVLYPDKHSWCKTTAIKQVVAGSEGCEGVEVENSVCVGTCFSYSIPRTEPVAPGQVEPYCDSCQPSKTTWKHVSLKCRDGGGGGSEEMKRVEIIEDCACSACDPGDPRVRETPSHPSQETLDVPQLIDLVNSTKNKSPRFNISQDRISLLLKVLDDNDEEKVDQEGLKEIMSQIIGDDENIDRNTLEDIAHKAEEMGHIKVDIHKLRVLLANRIGSESSEKFPQTHRHHHHHHHVHAPHHSRVLEEDQPTLDMAPHQLKPAVEGSEITYHNHPTIRDDEN